MVVIVVVQIKFQKAQLEVMDGGTISNSKRLKKKTRSNKRTFYC